MGFTSFNFLIFFPVTVLIYWITPSRFRWITLLLASYFFYINIKPVFALLLAGVTLSTYVFARLIDLTENENQKRNYMILNIILILLPLFFFKYFSGINNAVISVLDSLHLRWPLPQISLLLPVGISFYTFVAIGYTIDVYNDKIEAEKNIGMVALFISFFPLILSGPIERAPNMLPQFHNPRKLEYSMVVTGLKWMLWGYFMKLVVADRIGLYVDAVYGYIGEHNGTSLLFASFLYPFQIYADLGGYSLIAIGAASIMGINVMQNFRRPFFAVSMSEFWHRWHISLISWLTDYVYTPLSFYFRKYAIRGIVISLMITFMISGIWHGASLTFVVWGLIQGVYLSYEAIMRNRRANFENKYKLNSNFFYVAACIVNTLVLFSASLIFGRAPDIESAFMVFKKIFASQGPLFIGDPSTFIFILIGLPMLLIKDFMDEFAPSRMLLFENKYKAVRVLSYSIIIIFILLIGVLDGGQFIYFKF